MELMHLLPPAIAFLVFLTLGFVCHSYRDVANRHSDRPAAPFGHAESGADGHGSGH